MKRDLLLRLDRKISLIIRMWQDLGGPRILSLAAWREQVNRILANKRKVATRMGVDIHDRRGRSTALGKPESIAKYKIQITIKWLFSSINVCF